MAKSTVVLAAAAGLLFGLALVTHGDLIGPGGIVCPTGMHPTLGRPWAVGDTYQLVFLTVTGTPANLWHATRPYIELYDDVVNADARLSSSLVKDYDLDWKCIGSTSAVNARDHALVEAPIYLLDGTTKVADGFSDMWDGSLANPIKMYSTGAIIPYANIGVWTGTSGSGYATGTYLSRYPGGTARDYISQGCAGYTDSWWMYAYDSDHRASASLYALSPVLTITSTEVPEPATLTVLALGGLAVFARRRRP